MAGGPIDSASSAAGSAAARRGFTLVELLITIMIIAMLASMVLFALFRAQEEARSRKTSALIARLDAIVKGKWESYKTRRVPVVIPPGTDPRTAAKMRLDALRDLMRMEMPERWSDIVEVQVGDVVTTTPHGSATGIAEPAVWRSYLRRMLAAPAVPTVEHQGAECLYLTVMNAVTDETDARDIFKADNIGDVDNDGFPEFVDGWRRPIRFLRWAPGIQSDLHIVGRGTVLSVNPGPPATVTLSGPPLSASSGAFVGGTLAVLGPVNRSDGRPIDSLRTAKITGYDAASNTFTFDVPGGMTAFNDATHQPADEEPVVILAPDPFDPLGVYPNYVGTTVVASFAMYPLIYSAGPDGNYGIEANPTDPDNASAPWSYRVRYLANPANGLGPFVSHGMGTDPEDLLIGASTKTGSEPTGASVDNIHNHLLTAN